jgi:type II secretory pathway component PulC
MLVRSPLWILNSILGIIMLSVTAFMLIRRPEPPAKKTLTPAHQAPTPKKDVSTIDLKRIYDNDLFGTYTPTIPVLPVEQQAIPFPAAPVAQPVTVAPPSAVKVLPPLSVTLKGILFSSVEHDTLAIIADNKTKQESLHKVGDIVEDAEIIRIAKNHVIFIRSNGQQEVLFISLAEAQKDPHFATPPVWSEMVQKHNDFSYTINRKKLSEAIPSLAEFIDMVDLTIAFAKGVPVGCQIGAMKNSSVGPWLGLKQGDVVTHINGTSVSRTQERIDIYHTLKELSPNSTVVVAAQRNNKPITISYMIHDGQIQAAEQKPIEVSTKQLSSESPKHERDRRLADRSLDMDQMHITMQKNDRNFMAQYGGQSAMLKRTM